MAVRLLRRFGAHLLEHTDRLATIMSIESFGGTGQELDHRVQQLYVLRWPVHQPLAVWLGDARHDPRGRTLALAVVESQGRLIHPELIASANTIPAGDTTARIRPQTHSQAVTGTPGVILGSSLRCRR